MAGVLRVALVQPAPVDGDPASRANPGKAARLLGEAARYDPDLVVFPEYFPFHEGRELVEAIEDIGAYVVAGVARRVGGALYNTASIYAPDGRLVAWQGKRYVGRLERRLWGFTGWHGDYVVVDIGKARLGVGVCADFWSFPEAALELFLGGADLFVNPSYMFSLQGHWLSANLSRALEFYVPVVGVDLAAFPLRTRRYTFTGGGLSHVIVPPTSEAEAEEWWSSGALAPTSWVRLKLHTGEAIAAAEIDVAGASRLRRDWWDRMRGVGLEEWLREARARHRAARLVRA
ncbi:MAG: carbon-nitrogen hydrolase family protein [Desulfurococcales archaeon]|nr:carbon-nitrogen hydrolase family protein [Desulfurococcales archaeon]